MVALTLTSGQYGPKVLRRFLEDNASKISLGLFLGTVVYTLVVLTGYIKTDQPHLSALTARPDRLDIQAADADRIIFMDSSG